MNFFLEKTTNKIFMHLLTPFILQNFWKILRADPELWGCAIFGPKMTHLFWTNRPFLVQTIVITFIYLLALSILEHLKKFLQRLQSYDDMPFSGQDDPFAPNKIFFLENYQHHSHLPISPFHCAKFPADSYEDVQFLGPKWPISPNENFFSKPDNKPCFFYSCLSVCQKSKSDINLLVKYWWLKNTETSLAESHFWL